MGRASSLSAALGVLLACGILAAGEPQTKSPPGSRTAQADTDEPPEHQASTVQVELTSTVRVKHAKVGDQVKTRTVTALVLPNQIVIPEGSKVIGHVFRVSSGASVQRTALGIMFDRLEWKGRRNLPAKVSIVSAALPQRILPPVPTHEPDERLPAAGPDSALPRTSHMTGGLTVAHGSTGQGATPDPAPWMVQPLVDISARDRRGDLRGVERGTLIGMPGVTLRVDASSGAATFESANPNLELRGGLQMMVSVSAEEEQSFAKAGSVKK